MSAIGPVSGITGIAGMTGVQGVSGVSAAGTTSAAGAAGSTGTAGASFSNALGEGLDSLQSTQATADNLSVQAATGTLTNAHDLMIATTQAQLATQLTVALRNKAVDAFNEVMRMQI
jgi:flagellar hook-basal body complex protein FliE